MTNRATGESRNMNDRVILQIVGEAGAGKSDTCAYLAEKYGFTVVRVSDLIRDFARIHNIKLGSRAEYIAVHQRMKTELGEDCIPKMIMDLTSVRLCVDGLRVVNDVSRLRAAPGVVRVVALDCPAEIRFFRTQQRKASRDKLTFEEFLKDDLQDAYNADPEAPNTIAVMKSADYHIDASQPRGQVFAQIDAIVAPLLRS